MLGVVFYISLMFLDTHHFYKSSKSHSTCEEQDCQIAVTLVLKFLCLFLVHFSHSLKRVMEKSRKKNKVKVRWVQQHRGDGYFPFQRLGELLLLICDQTNFVTLGSFLCLLSFPFCMSSFTVLRTVKVMFWDWILVGLL